MDYKRIYDELIAFRQANIPSGYVERHHIIMCSLGGLDDSINLVALTGREHWIAHLLLHKIYRRSETAHACNMMAMRCEERGIGYIKNSRMYEKIRKECAKLTSIRNSASQSGERNSQHGTRWICNIDLKENKKILKTDAIPEGWIAGRDHWNRFIEKQCLKCKTIFFGKRLVKYCSSACRSRKLTDEEKHHLSRQALLSGRNSGKNNGMHKSKLSRLASVSERASNA